jgi:protein-tyrosine phosphatase
MIDIHHHCLPGVDDGPRTAEEAVDLCRMSADEGIETIVATPHVLRGRWKNTSRAQLEAVLADLQSRIGDTPRLLLGSEYFFAHDIAEVMRSGTAIIPLAGSRYILVEFASNAVPPLVMQPLHAVMLDGWMPIIAHPERNTVLQSKPELVGAMARAGVKMQVTTGSVLGDFGEEARTAAGWMLRGGYAHFMATDTHNRAKRPPRVRAAREKVAELCGAAVAQALFVDNPQAVVDGQGLPYDPDIPERVEKPGVMDRIRSFFGSGS